MYKKYPRTPHLPWSVGTTNDDKFLINDHHFINKKIIITEKRDGENFTIYSDGYCHARSLNRPQHPSQDMIKSELVNWCYQIPKNYRICGEYLYAIHSIQYENLNSYFEVFSIYDDNDYCLSWEDTIEYCSLLNLKTVPILYEGIYDKNIILDIQENMDFKKQEGYVIRLSDKFHYDDFYYSIAKFVRENHVSTDTHWKHSWDETRVNTIGERGGTR